MSTARADRILSQLGLASGEGDVESIDPTTGKVLGRVRSAGRGGYQTALSRANDRFLEWRTRPAPRRGDLVRRLGERLRERRELLGELISLEVGKIRAEGVGEVQEMIDICDFAVGLSRQLHGLTIASERPRHRMLEQWHPLGPVGVITAFNFPMAVWAWNAALAAVCGDVVLWKPSPRTPLTAQAVHALCLEVLAEADAGGDLAVRAIAFGAVGTAGQRCTSTRRVFAQRGVAGKLRERLLAAYRTVTIGDPLDEGVLMGPLCSRAAVERYLAALEQARSQGGDVIHGGKALPRDGFFVEPTLVVAPAQAGFPIAWEETFAPILYLFEVDDLEQAIAAHNAVPQGLSSAIFTESMRAAERFLSPAGSDCGIANVNLGTSGAEIGGAFGGEKDTGGGRESGSDAWRAYMRRQTCTINWGGDLPLAQGIKFL